MSIYKRYRFSPDVIQFIVMHIEGSFYSKLDNGNYLQVNISGTFGGGVAGLPLGFSGGKMRGSDPHNSVYPYSFETRSGEQSFISGGTYSAIGGANFSWGQFGDVTFEPSVGFVAGVDLSIYNMFGDIEVDSFREVPSDYAAYKGCSCED